MRTNIICEEYKDIYSCSKLNKWNKMKNEKNWTKLSPRVYQKDTQFIKLTEFLILVY